MRIILVTLGILAIAAAVQLRDSSSTTLCMLLFDGGFVAGIWGVALDE